MKQVKARREPEAKKMAAVLLMLKAPGLSPYVQPYRTQQVLEYDACRRNGWCPRPPVNFYAGCQEAGGTCPARFLSFEERQAAVREDVQLAKLEKAPDVLIHSALEYAKAHPNDPLVPEALHYAVRQTRSARNTCGGEGEVDARSWLSKQAFQLLHQRYQRSEWTKRTPHHY